MKRICLIITAVVLIIFLAKVASAGEIAKSPMLPKGPQGMAKISTATPLAPPANRPGTKPLLLKPALPVDAGKQHGPATVGGAPAGASQKKAVINGTAMKRSP